MDLSVMSPNTPQSDKCVARTSLVSTGSPSSANSVTMATPVATPTAKTPKGKKGKTKVLYFWSSEDVNKWLRKHCGQYYQLYGQVFLDHDISGRALVRLSDTKLKRLGIMDAQHREDLMRHILRLKQNRTAGTQDTGPKRWCDF